MEINNALEILKRLRIATATSNVDGDRILEPLSMGIEALEKQVPKQPTNESWFGECPTCNYKFNSKEEYDVAYCSNCGQRLSWI